MIHARYKNVAQERFIFLQPFFFTLNTQTANIESASAPLVTDDQLGGDGELRYHERTERLTFEVIHKNQPFTFFVDASSVVGIECGDPHIPDPNLKLAILAARTRPSGDITCGDMQELTTLAVIDKPVQYPRRVAVRCQSAKPNPHQYWGYGSQ